MRERRTGGTASLGPTGNSGQKEAEGRIKDAGCSVRAQWPLLASLLVFRVVNALLSYSAFVPDEYYQALEVAHRMVFGYPEVGGVYVCEYCK